MKIRSGLASAIANFFRDPLIHFLGIGIALFFGWELLSPSTPAELDQRVVRVDRDSLLTFVQYRSRLFDPDRAAQVLDSMSADARRLLVDDFIREQVLYREALALGLDSDDYVIKQRLIQKIEFITEGFIEAAINLSEEDIAEEYAARKDEYLVMADITFTHVFFDAERRGADAASIQALAKLEELNATDVPFTEAPRHGDRFLYHVNYVERTREYVTSHFGLEMSESLFRAPIENVWQGPFASPYGSHLVMVTNRNQERYPELEEVRNRVVGDLRRAQIRQQKEEMIAEIVASYQLELDPEFETLMDR